MGHNNKLNWLLLAALSIIWGSSFILMHRGLNAYSPAQIGALRMFMAFLSTLPFLFFFKINWKKIPLGPVAFVVIFGSAIPSVLFPLAETQINHSLAGILNSLTPIFTMALGVLFFGLRFGRNKIIGLSLGLGGALLIALFQKNLDSAGMNHYVLAVVFATICYAASVNVIKQYLQDVPSPIINFMGLGLLAIPALLYLLSTNFLEVLPTAEGRMAAFYICLLGVFGTGIANYLFFLLVQRTDALFSSMVTYTITAVSVVWGILDGEAITWMQVVAMLSILWGVRMIGERKVQRRI